MPVCDYADWSDDQMKSRENAATPESLAQALAWRKVHALEAMAQDHQGRAEMLREAAKALRAQAGLPEAT